MLLVRATLSFLSRNFSMISQNFPSTAPFTWQNTITVTSSMPSFWFGMIFHHFQIPASHFPIKTRSLSLEMRRKAYFPLRSSQKPFLDCLINFCNSAWEELNGFRTQEVLDEGWKRNRKKFLIKITQMYGVSRDCRSLRLTTTEHSLLCFLFYSLNWFALIPHPCRSLFFSLQKNYHPPADADTVATFPTFPQSPKINNHVVIACLIASESLCGNLICIFHLVQKGKSEATNCRK